MENQSNPTPEEKPVPPFRGLYRYVKISVKALDRIIIACIAVILLVVAIEMRNPGFTITFDSKGGTDVVSQEKMYGDHVDLPEPPTRDGYVFTGWYAEETCVNVWDMENYIVNDNLTLYAGWEKAE